MDEYQTLQELAREPLHRRYLAILQTRIAELESVLDDWQRVHASFNDMLNARLDDSDIVAHLDGAFDAVSARTEALYQP